MVQPIQIHDQKILKNFKHDLEKRQQSEARIDRIGQTKKMTYIDIMAQDTIDERIVKALRTKVNIANKIMDEDFREWI
jgi:SNF2 family DNA or RNA helicase